MEQTLQVLIEVPKFIDNQGNFFSNKIVGEHKAIKGHTWAAENKPQGGHVRVRSLRYPCNSHPMSIKTRSPSLTCIYKL